MKKLLALGVIVATLFISGCLNDAGKSSEQATVQPASNQVVLYFANQDLTKLVSERRDLTNTPRSPQAAVDLLLNGPKSNVAQILFPKDVKCLGVKTVNGVATVDFNDAIKTLGKLFLKNAFQQLSTEWKLSISLLEIIFQYANKDFNFAEMKLTEIKRTFKKQLKQRQMMTQWNFTENVGFQFLN